VKGNSVTYFPVVLMKDGPFIAEGAHTLYKPTRNSFRIYMHLARQVSAAKGEVLNARVVENDFEWTISWIGIDSHFDAHDESRYMGDVHQATVKPQWTPVIDHMNPGGVAVGKGMRTQISTAMHNFRSICAHQIRGGHEVKGCEYHVCSTCGI
jgi:hypothetical protein